MFTLNIWQDLVCRRRPPVHGGTDVHRHASGRRNASMSEANGLVCMARFDVRRAEGDWWIPLGSQYEFFRYKHEDM